MPSLGADMESGTLILWHVKPGDSLKRGDIIADVETEKGIIEVEVWTAGKVVELLVEPGRKVPVGSVLALLADEKPEAAEAPQSVEQPRIEIAPPEAIPIRSREAKPELGPERRKRLRVSPLARRFALERGIDLALVNGTGPYSAITKADIVDFQQKSYANTGAREPMAESSPQNRTAAMRHAIALAMSRSKREIPHYYLQTQLNAQNALSHLDKMNQERPLSERLLPVALYIKAVAKACASVPEMNGFWIDGDFHASSAVHAGIAIALRQGGLIAPAIHNVEAMTLTDIMANMLDLVARARSGKLKSSEISDPTITITNLGDQGVETVFGVIYPPQVALVGFGKISSQPWAENQMLGVMPVLALTLAADHRASDGHRGGMFLREIAHLLANPEQLEEL